jgi:hypothetical protein
MQEANLLGSDTRRDVGPVEQAEDGGQEAADHAPGHILEGDRGERVVACKDAHDVEYHRSGQQAKREYDQHRVNRAPASFILLSTVLSSARVAMRCARWGPGEVLPRHAPISGYRRSWP